MKFTPRSILLAIFMAVYLTVLGIIILPVLLLRYFNVYGLSDSVVAWGVSTWGKGVVFVSGSKYKVYGKENMPDHNRVLLLSNHQSHFDGPLIVATWKRIIGAVSKKELAKIPVFKQWAVAAHSPFIDRKNREEAIAQINQRIDDIQKGWPLLMFPEGTRSKSNEISKFKRGGLASVLKSGVLVLPVTLINTHKAYEGAGNAITPRKDLVIIYHPAIDTSKLDQTDAEGFALMLEKIIAPANQKL